MIPEAWRCVAGGFLIHLVLGSLYCWTNITAGVTSYLRLYDDNVSYNQTIMVFAAQLLLQGFTMYLGGKIELKYGVRSCVFTGGLFIVAGTYFAACSTTLLELVLSYGIGFGAGVGVSYSTPISVAVAWNPEKKGLITGAIVAGFGLGSLVFGKIALHVMDPGNQNVNPETHYYDADSNVPHRVPRMFIILGSIYASFYVVALWLLVPKLSNHSDSKPMTRKHNNSKTKYKKVNNLAVESEDGKKYKMTANRTIEHAKEDEDKYYFKSGKKMYSIICISYSLQ